MENSFAFLSWNEHPNGDCTTLAVTCARLRSWCDLLHIFTQAALFWINLTEFQGSRRISIWHFRIPRLQFDLSATFHVHEMSKCLRFAIILNLPSLSTIVAIYFYLNSARILFDSQRTFYFRYPSRRWRPSKIWTTAICKRQPKSHDRKNKSTW